MERNIRASPDMWEKLEGKNNAWRGKKDGQLQHSGQKQEILSELRSVWQLETK